MVYAEGSLSLRTEKDFNLRADKNINIEAVKKLNVRSGDNYNLNIGNQIIQKQKVCSLESGGANHVNVYKYVCVYRKTFAS